MPLRDNRKTRRQAASTAAASSSAPTPMQISAPPTNNASLPVPPALPPLATASVSTPLPPVPPALPVPPVPPVLPVSHALPVPPVLPVPPPSTTPPSTTPSPANIPSVTPSSSAAKESGPPPSKSADKEKKCIYRGFSIHIGEGEATIRGPIGQYEYYSKILLKAKTKKLTPQALTVTEGFRAMIYERPEVFDVVSIRIAQVGAPSICLMVHDPLDAKAEVFPIDIRNITLLTPPAADWDSKRGEEYFSALKKKDDEEVKKAAERKRKRASINIPEDSKDSKSAKSRSPADNSSNNQGGVAFAAAVEAMLARVEGIVREQHAFFDRLEQRQRENFQQILLSQQNYFCNLLNVIHR